MTRNYTFEADELNGIGVNNVDDVGYVRTSGNGGQLWFTTYPDVGECAPRSKHFVLTPWCAQLSSAVLVDLENVGVAFVISLLSCVEAETLRYFSVTSGNEQHGHPSIIEQWSQYRYLNFDTGRTTILNWSFRDKHMQFLSYRTRSLSQLISTALAVNSLSRRHNVKTLCSSGANDILPHQQQRSKRYLCIQMNAENIDSSIIPEWWRCTHDGDIQTTKTRTKHNLNSTEWEDRQLYRLQKHWQLIKITLITSKRLILTWHRLITFQ